MYTHKWRELRRRMEGNKRSRGENKGLVRLWVRLKGEKWNYQVLCSCETSCVARAAAAAAAGGFSHFPFLLGHWWHSELDCAVCVCRSLFFNPFFFLFVFFSPVCDVNYTQSISASIFCCVDLAYRKRGDWSCRSPLLLTLFFLSFSPVQYLVKAGRARAIKWWAIGRSVLGSLSPRVHSIWATGKTKKVMPQLKAGGQKKKKSLYTRVGAIRSGFVLLTFSPVHQNENGRRRRRK